MKNNDPKITKICDKFNFESQKEEITKALKNLCNDNYNNNEEENNNDNDNSDDNSDENSEDEESGPNLIAGVFIYKKIKLRNY
jgi:hypothetical protein